MDLWVAMTSDDSNNKVISLAQIKAAKKFASGHGMSEKEYCAYLDRLKPEQTQCNDPSVVKGNDDDAQYVFPLLHQTPDDEH
tara:strand:+ start:2148 stop:2393 length:246 start_codon:yes stop_codon:yes gene_type:complete